NSTHTHQLYTPTLHTNYTHTHQLYTHTNSTQPPLHTNSLRPLTHNTQNTHRNTNTHTKTNNIHTHTHTHTQIQVRCVTGTHCVGRWFPCTRAHTHRCARHGSRTLRSHNHP